MKINMTGMIYIISFIPGICCCPISCCFMVYMVFRILVILNSKQKRLK